MDIEPVTLYAVKRTQAANKNFKSNFSLYYVKIRPHHVLDCERCALQLKMRPNRIKKMFQIAFTESWNFDLNKTKQKKNNNFFVRFSWIVK